MREGRNENRATLGEGSWQPIRINYDMPRSRQSVANAAQNESTPSSLEKTPEEYVANMVEVFREVRECYG